MYVLCCFHLPLLLLGQGSAMPTVNVLRHCGACSAAAVEAYRPTPVRLNLFACDCGLCAVPCSVVCRVNFLSSMCNASGAVIVIEFRVVSKPATLIPHVCLPPAPAQVAESPHTRPCGMRDEACCGWFAVQIVFISRLCACGGNCQILLVRGSCSAIASSSQYRVFRGGRVCLGSSVDWRRAHRV